MRTVTKFALEQHQAPYQRWPLRSRLIVDGVLSARRVPGYQLLQQFETDDGYLLITDYDCPFEEATAFVLLDQTCRVVARKSLAVPYGSYLLDSVDMIDDRRLLAIFYDNDRWQLTIRPRRVMRWWPRLKLERIKVAQS